MDDNTRIAKDKTVGHWKKLKNKLKSDMKNNELWREAFKFFELRVNTRYIGPITLIERETKDKFMGEGFAIVTLYCALIEFLEASYQGKNYKFIRRGETLKENEYNRSSDMFKSFLRNRPPFKNFFDQGLADLADDFYENVRCGLLHEAETKGSWVIRADSRELFEERNGEKVLDRDILQQAIDEYILFYKDELFKSLERKKAFIRKMNSICEIKE